MFITACEVMEDVTVTVLLLLAYNLSIHGRRGKSVILLMRLVEIEQVLIAGVSTKVSKAFFYSFSWGVGGGLQNFLIFTNSK